MLPKPDNRENKIRQAVSELTPFKNCFFHLFSGCARKVIQSVLQKKAYALFLLFNSKWSRL